VDTRLPPPTHGRFSGKNSAVSTSTVGERVILDTGVIYADMDADDDWHHAAAELLATTPGRLRVPSLVVTEVCYLANTRLGPDAEAAFLSAVGHREYDVVDLTLSDYVRTAELVTKYANLPLGAVDASVIALAERLPDLDVATTDRRHFYVVEEARSFTLNLVV
jgi:predicted nucleic acid-binding protein